MSILVIMERSHSGRRVEFVSNSLDRVVDERHCNIERLRLLDPLWSRSGVTPQNSHRILAPTELVRCHILIPNLYSSKPTLIDSKPCRA